MNNALPAHRPVHWVVLLGTAVLITLFLYYIDEGRYSLEGLFTPGNALAMSAYLIGLMSGLFLISELFARRQPGPGRTLVILFLGTVVGFLIGLLLILVLGALLQFA